MLGGLIVELGWCGFGIAGGLFPEVRLGVLRIATYRGSVLVRLVELNEALQVAIERLRELSKGKVAAE